MNNLRIYKRWMDELDDDGSDSFPDPVEELFFLTDIS